MHLLHSGELAQRRIIGSGDLQSLQPALPVFDEVSVTLRVEAHAMGADEAIHLPVVRPFPLGEQVPLEIADADMRGNRSGHYLLCQRACAFYPEHD